MKHIRSYRFTQNQLKILAAVSMFIDHIGAELFPQVIVLRIIGRLAFPIFSFFIYEGFKYTHNKKRYLLRIFLLGILCAAVYYLYSGRIYGNVLITFSASIIALYSISVFRERISGNKKDKVYGMAVAFGCCSCIYFICTWIYIDYGFCGVLLPIFADIAGGLEGKKNRHMVLAGFCAGLIILSMQTGGIQYFSLLAVPLLAMYNGHPGPVHMRSFFYWFYPAHLAAVGILALSAG